MSSRKWLVGGLTFLSVLTCVVCLGIVVVASFVLAVGWILNWLFPALSFEMASVIAGEITIVTAVLFLLAGVVLSNSLSAAQPLSTDAEDDSDNDFDDDDDVEALAERVKELAMAKLSQSMPVERRYKSSRPRQK